MVFNLKTKAARDMVLKEFKATNYGVVNPRTIDNVSRSSPLCASPLTLCRSSTSCYTNNSLTIPSPNGRSSVAKKSLTNNLPPHPISPSAITLLSSAPSSSRRPSALGATAAAMPSSSRFKADSPKN